MAEGSAPVTPHRDRRTVRASAPSGATSRLLTGVSPLPARPLTPCRGDNGALARLASVHAHGMETPPLHVRPPRPLDLDAAAQHQYARDTQERAPASKRLHSERAHKQRQGHAHNRHTKAGTACSQRPAAIKRAARVRCARYRSSRVGRPPGIRRGFGDAPAVDAIDPIIVLSSLSPPLSTSMQHTVVSLQQYHAHASRARRYPRPRLPCPPLSTSARVAGAASSLRPWSLPGADAPMRPSWRPIPRFP